MPIGAIRVTLTFRAHSVANKQRRPQPHKRVAEQRRTISALYKKANPLIQK
jgi:hypothetical protein